MQVVTNGDYSKLIATKKYQSDDIIRVLTGIILDKPTRTSIQTATDIHVEDVYGQFMNHSFKPSTRIFNGCIVAITEIKPGDEITFNYNESESQMSCPFVDNATGIHVTGFNFL